MSYKEGRRELVVDVVAVGQERTAVLADAVESHADDVESRHNE